MTRTGVYPGSFDPPTLAQLEIARTARDVHGLSRIDLAVSCSALGKSSPLSPNFEERLEVIQASVSAVDGGGVDDRGRPSFRRGDRSLDEAGPTGLIRN